MHFIFTASIRFLGISWIPYKMTGFLRVVSVSHCLANGVSEKYTLLRSCCAVRDGIVIKIYLTAYCVMAHTEGITWRLATVKLHINMHHFCLILIHLFVISFSLSEICLSRFPSLWVFLILKFKVIQFTVMCNREKDQKILKRRYHDELLKTVSDKLWVVKNLLHLAHILNHDSYTDNNTKPCLILKEQTVNQTKAEGNAFFCGFSANCVAGQEYTDVRHCTTPV